MLVLFSSTVYLELFSRDRISAVDVLLMSWLSLGMKMMLKLTTTLPGEKFLTSILTWPASTIAFISGDRDWYIYW